MYTFHNAAQLSARLAVTELLVFWDGFNETPRSLKHFKMISFRPPANKNSKRFQRQGVWRKRKEGRELSGGVGEERCKGRALEEVETTFKPSVAQRAGGIIYITPTSD